ncbi:MAG: hypothetical protein ACRDTF_15685 [Pseudonocardiaceae bacterium]
MSSGDGGVGAGGVVNLLLALESDLEAGERLTRLLRAELDIESIGPVPAGTVPEGADVYRRSAE